MRITRLKISALVPALRAFCASSRGRLPIAPAEITCDDFDELVHCAIENSSRPRPEHGGESHSIAPTAAGIAHDLNNLLTVITGNSQLGLMECNNPASRRRWSEVLGASQLAAAFTQKLMAVSHQEILQLKPISPNAVIREGIELLARLAGDHIAIKTSLALDAGTILINPAELLQVLMNLVLNAREAMASGGTLTIETRTHVQPQAESDDAGLSAGRYVILTVIDTGRGMNEAIRSHAFEAFFSTKTTSERSGMGLAIVSAIVHKSGGQVSLMSRTGEGTTFHLYFPEAGQA